MTEAQKPLDLRQFIGHTPGPWWTTLEHPAMTNGLYRGLLCFLEHSGEGTQPGCRLVAVCVDDDGRAWQTTEPQVIEANARLMAAAPDLLAEVERLRGALKAIRDHLPEVAKLTPSESEEITFCPHCDGLYERTAGLHSWCPPHADMIRRRDQETSRNGASEGYHLREMARVALGEATTDA